MKLSAKTKNALGTLRKEFGLTPSDISTLLDHNVSLERIIGFENAHVEDDYLACFYLDLFSLIAHHRPHFDIFIEDFDYEPNGEILDIPKRQTRFNPFKRN